jgi:hypothetical protein
METTSRNLAVTPVDQLAAGCVNVVPVECDWSTGLGDNWHYWEAVRCDTCGGIAGTALGEVDLDEPHTQPDSEIQCNGCLIAGEGPMMNYYYPIRDGVDPDWAARQIAHLPLCVVELEDSSFALALTGGGMDFSWEICEAFMRLGYLPPVHFTLPSMAGYKLNPVNQWIIEGCRKSREVQMNWRKNELLNLDNLEQWMSDNG